MVPREFVNPEHAPVQIIDTANMTVLAGPKGLKPGHELTVGATLTPPPFPFSSSGRTGQLTAGRFCR